MKKEFEEAGFWKDDYTILLIANEEGRFIGEVSSFKSSPNIQGPQIAYRIYHEQDRRKGYATEAVTLFSACLFETESNIQRITAIIRQDNASSIGSVRKCGFQREGALRNAWLCKGVPYSYEIYSLLREKSPDLRSALQSSEPR